MTGITQSPDRNTSARPSNGIRSMQNEEAVIMQRLTDQQVEAMVERYWKDCTPPPHIAGLIRSRYPQSMMFITARWVESIKRRIDNRKRRD